MIPIVSFQCHFGPESFQVNDSNTNKNLLTRSAIPSKLQDDDKENTNRGPQRKANRWCQSHCVNPIDVSMTLK